MKYGVEWCPYKIVKKYRHWTDRQTDRPTEYGKTISRSVCIACWRAIKPLNNTFIHWSYYLHGHGIIQFSHSDRVTSAVDERNWTSLRLFDPWTWYRQMNYSDNIDTTPVCSHWLGYGMIHIVLFKLGWDVSHSRCGCGRQVERWEAQRSLMSPDWSQY